MSELAAGADPVGVVRQRPDPATAKLLRAVAGVYPDWRVWVDADGWHARRAGDFWMVRDGASGVYYVGHSNPWAFILLLNAQDQIRNPVYWPDRPPAEVPRAVLYGLRRGLQRLPIDAARDALALEAEARHPGYRFSHHLFGWTAVSVADATVTFYGADLPGLEAVMPQKAYEPDGA